MRSTSPVWRRSTPYLLQLRAVIARSREARAAMAHEFREGGVRMLSARDEARARAALYAGPDLLALLERVRVEVRAGHLLPTSVEHLEEVAHQLVLEQMRREVLLGDAEEEHRFHLGQLETTGQETSSFWYAQQDVTARRADLLRTAEQVNHVRAELETLLARAYVSRAHSLSPTHNQE